MRTEVTKAEYRRLKREREAAIQRIQPSLRNVIALRLAREALDRLPLDYSIQRDGDPVGAIERAQGVEGDKS